MRLTAAARVCRAPEHVDLNAVDSSALHVLDPKHHGSRAVARTVATAVAEGRLENDLDRVAAPGEAAELFQDQARHASS